MFLKKWFRYVILPIIVSLIVLYLTCIIPPREIPILDQCLLFDIPNDKLVHFLMFFGLSFVIYIDYFFMHKKYPRFVKWIFWGFLIPLLYGGLIEIIQYKYVPERSGDWIDFIADALGIIFSTIIALIFLRRKKNRNIRQ